MQFFRSNRSAAISASPEVLTVSLLEPYTTWQDFKSLILSNFLIFKEVISPKCLKRIGLRYINRFDFSESPTERLEDIFNFHPTVPQDLPQVYAAFADRVEIPYEDGRNRFGVALQTISEKPDVLSFILDLAYYTATPESAESVALDSIGEWIETAHDRIEDAFEKCITDRCRTRFGGTKSNPDEIDRFLFDNSFLQDILLEAPGYIYRIFGRVALHLEYFCDPSDGTEELFVLIKSPFSIRESIMREGQLFEEWFYDKIDSARGKLDIVEEPA